MLAVLRLAACIALIALFAAPASAARERVAPAFAKLEARAAAQGRVRVIARLKEDDGPLFGRRAKRGEIHLAKPTQPPEAGGPGSTIYSDLSA